MIKVCKLFLALFIFSLLVISPSANAELLAHEGFNAQDTAVGNDLHGYGRSSTGLACHWSKPKDGMSATFVEGLSLGKLQSSGHAVSFHRNDASLNASRYFSRPLDFATDQTLWISYLVRWTKDNGGDGHSLEIGLGSFTHNDDHAFTVHTRALSVNSADRFAVGYDRDTVTEAKTSNKPNTTYLVVARWGQGKDADARGTMWLFDSADAVNQIVGAKDLEVNRLNAAAAEVVNVEAAQAGAITKQDFLKIGGFVGGGPGTYEATIDEIRIGTTAADVLPLADGSEAAKPVDFNAGTADATPPTLPGLTWGEEPVVAMSETRSEIVLNGLWKFMPALPGMEEPTEQGWGYIWVPGSWKKKDTWRVAAMPGIAAAGKGRMWDEMDDKTLYRAWYERSITVPADWAGRAVVLELPRVSTDATVTLDGNACGEVHWPGGTVDLTDAVTPGQLQTLRIQVLATHDQGLVKMYMADATTQVLEVKAELFTKGITEDVILASRPKSAHVAGVFVQPSTRKQQVTVEVELSDIDEAGEVAFTAEMLGPDGEVEKTFKQTAQVKAADEQTVSLTWDWDDAQLWSPETPNLYTLRLTTRGAGVNDAYTQGFGFREFWVEGKDFYLNGMPFRLRPFSFGLIMGTADLYRAGFENMIEAGFNITEVWPNEIRRGVAYPDDMYYRIADEVGFPMMARAGSMVGILNEKKWDDPESRQKWIDTTQHIVRRNRNHPSILVWAHSGNVFGYGNDISPQLMGKRDVLHNPGVLDKYRKGEEACDVIRAIDPTRAVMTHHGGYVGDIHTANHYLNLIPLQEREQWMSEHVMNADMPYCGIEFGAPDNLTFFRNRTDHGSSGVSEPWHTEFAAIYLGPEAYKLETDWFRADIIAGYKGIEEHKGAGTVFRWHSWQYRKQHPIQPQFQEVLALFINNTWRSFRAAGHTGGVLPWSGAHAWTNLNHSNPADPAPWGGKEFKDRVVFNTWTPGTRGPWYPHAPKGSYEPFTAEHQTQQLAGDALVANGQPTLAYISGGIPDKNEKREVAGDMLEARETQRRLAEAKPAFYRKDHHYEAGETIVKQIAIINDSRAKQKYRFTVALKMDGQVVEQIENDGEVEVGRNLFIPVQFKTPQFSGHKADAVISLSTQIGEVSHTDELAIRIWSRPRSSTARDQAPVAIYDPKGQTTAMLESAGESTKPWDGKPVPRLYIGREAFSDGAPLPGDLEQLVLEGAEVVIFQQHPDYLRASGFRVSQHVERRVFPIANHPFNFGLEARDLRDWRGNGTLLPPVSPVGSGETPQPPFGWRWGNTGSVSSAAIEKPHHSGWRPILECGFDLQYTPLMELEVGKGRVIWCQLDLEDHVAAGDPVAERIVRRLVEGWQRPVGAVARDRYHEAELKTLAFGAESSGEAQQYLVAPVRATSVFYLGGDAAAQQLSDLGVLFKRVDALPEARGDDRVLVIISGDAKTDDSALNAFMEAGGNVVFLARPAGAAPLGVTITRIGEVPALKPWVHGRGSALNLGTPEEWAKLFHGATSVPEWTEARGLSLSDLRFRTFHPANVITGGAEIGADGLLARKIVGKGVAIFCQVDPTMFDTEKQPYLRFTRWRQTRAMAQVLANLGANFESDAQTIHLRPTRLLLAGDEWKAKLTAKLPPILDWKDRLPSRPISDEAKVLVGVEVDDSNWQRVSVPDVWDSYGAEWRGLEGEAVYRRMIDLPTTWAGKEMVLEFGRFQSNKQTLRDQDETFFNGQRVGGAGDYWASRSYAVPASLVKAGPNVLAVRLASKIGGGGILTSPNGLYIRLKDEVWPSLYHPDYRDDWAEGDEPYRWVRW